MSEKESIDCTSNNINRPTTGDISGQKGFFPRSSISNMFVGSAISDGTSKSFPKNLSELQKTCGVNPFSAASIS